MDFTEALPEIIGSSAGGLFAIAAVLVAHRMGSKQVQMNWMRDKTLESYLEFHREMSDFLRHAQDLRRSIESGLSMGPAARVEALAKCNDLRIISDRSRDALERVLITSDDEFFLHIEDDLTSYREGIIKICEDWARDESCSILWDETPMQDGMALDELFERHDDALVEDAIRASVYFREYYYPKLDLVKPLRRYSKRVFHPGE